MQDHSDILSAARRRAGRLLRGLALLVAIGGARTAAAQAGGDGDVMAPTPATGRASLTRDQLTLLANAAMGNDRVRMLDRLREGDFNIGDRIVLQMKRDSVITTDTLVVRAGRTLELDGIPPISLQGVLRSELDDRLNREIGRYIRSPNVHTGTLFRLAVLGEVGKPNFYYVSADMLISDVVVLAGGPTGNADIGKSTVKRGDQTIIDTKRLQRALREGETLDKLSLRAGDEMDIGKKRTINWQTIATTGGLIVSLSVTAISLFRHH